MDKKITYKELKSKQKQDIKSGAAGYVIYRPVSTPFTWILVKLGIQPNTITILSSFLCFLGFYFLSLGTYQSIIAGIVFFLFFKIMDMCDGEVARIQDKTSIEGLYFDRLGHYIFSCCFGLGLGLGLYRLYQGEIYLLLGFLFTLVLVVENAKIDLLNSLFRKEVIDKKISSKTASSEKPDRYFQKKLADEIYNGKSWTQSNIITRLIGIYPFQGLIFSDTFIITPLLFTLAITEYILNTSVGFPSDIIGLMPMYIIIISAVKIINIFIFIIKLKRKSYLTRLAQKIESK